MKKAIDVISEKISKNENAIILFLGDSITFGETHCTSEETYCAEIARLFAKQFQNTKVVRYDGISQGEAMPLKGYSKPIVVQNGDKGTITVIRCGVGGDTVRRAINRKNDYIGKFITNEYPDIFVMMFGINDALCGDESKFVLPEKFFDDYKELCGILEDNNKDALKIFMTPTYNDLGNSKKSFLDSYAEKVKEIARITDSQCIDTHKLWMDHLEVGSENYGQRDWLSGVEGDGCHFSPEGSKNTAQFIFSELIKKNEDC